MSAVMTETPVRVRYRVVTPSVPGPELPLMDSKAHAEKIAARTTKAGHPSEVQEVLLRGRKF